MCKILEHHGQAEAALRQTLFMGSLRAALMARAALVAQLQRVATVFVA